MIICYSRNVSGGVFSPGLFVSEKIQWRLYTRVRIKAKLNRGGIYYPAILTNEHAEASYGLPVVVIDGEACVRDPSQVYCIRVSDFEWADMARKAGYLALKG
jgi:hypothetical protein